MLVRGELLVDCTEDDAKLTTSKADFTPIRSNTVAKLTSQQFRAKHWRLCYPPPPIRRLRGIVCYFACRRSLSDLISVHYRQSAFFIFTYSGWESTWPQRRYQTQQFLIDDAEKRMRIRHFANPCLIGGISERAISDVFDPRDNPQTRVAQYISRSTEYRTNSRVGPKTGVTRMTDQSPNGSIGRRCNLATWRSPRLMNQIRGQKSYQ